MGSTHVPRRKVSIRVVPIRVCAATVRRIAQTRLVVATVAAVPVASVLLPRNASTVNASARLTALAGIAAMMAAAGRAATADRAKPAFPMPIRPYAVHLIAPTRPAVTTVAADLAAIANAEIPVPKATAFSRHVTAGNVDPTVAAVPAVIVMKR